MAFVTASWNSFGVTPERNGLSSAPTFVSRDLIAASFSSAARANGLIARPVRLSFALATVAVKLCR